MGSEMCIRDRIAHSSPFVHESFCGQVGHTLIKTLSLKHRGRGPQGGTRLETASSHHDIIDRPHLDPRLGGGRPLSSSMDALRQMEAQRRPLYLAAADAVISNTGTLAEALAAAQEALDEIFDS